MRRPPSYSDSFFDYRDFTGASTSIQETISEEIGSELGEQEQKGCWRYIETALLLCIKGGFHIFTISIFETIFYFTYVSQSENTGILKTINTYYTPLLQTCYSLNSTLRVDIFKVLQVLGVPSQAVVDADGMAAGVARNQKNLSLLRWSIGYSAISLGFSLVTIILYTKLVKKRIGWKDIAVETFWFVFVLGFYEWFFFETIIYNYSTLSTPELNQYLVDGLYGCLLST